MGIRCEPSRALDVERELAGIEEVRYVGLVTGRYDFLVHAFFGSRDGMLECLVERVAKIPGIVQMETLHVLRVSKLYFWTYDYSQLPSAE